MRKLFALILISVALFAVAGVVNAYSPCSEGNYVCYEDE